MERRCEVNAILEGGELVIPLDANAPERTRKGKIKMHGWRHYLCILNGRKANVISLPMDAEKAAKYNAKFWPRGTWEDATREVKPGFMPTPRAEILAEIFNAAGEPPATKTQQ